MIYSNGSIKKCYKKAVISLIFIKKYRIFATGNFMSMLWHSSDENPSIAWHDFFFEQLRLLRLAGNNNF